MHDWLSGYYRILLFGYIINITFQSKTSQRLLAVSVSLSLKKQAVAPSNFFISPLLFFFRKKIRKKIFRSFLPSFFFLNIFSLKSPINLNYCNVGSRQSRDRMPQITHVSISQLQGARIFSRVEKERKKEKKSTDKLRID